MSTAVSYACPRISEGMNTTLRNVTLVQILEQYHNPFHEWRKLSVNCSYNIFHVRHNFLFYERFFLSFQKILINFISQLSVKNSGLNLKLKCNKEKQELLTSLSSPEAVERRNVTISENYLFLLPFNTKWMATQIKYFFRFIMETHRPCQ